MWQDSSAIWLAVGFLGQLFFTARFAVQWAVSEQKRDSIVPVAFWWLSLAGGGALLSYAIHRHDPVIIIGQGLGLFVYVRNLMLVNKARRRWARRELRQRMALPTGLVLDGNTFSGVSHDSRSHLVSPSQ
jgi:lipid-A-disaccharide synthase-like uncharacterized protein